MFYKRRTGKPTLSYSEAVEEALCFGWIDGRGKRIDDKSHTIRFTPRRPGSIWSKVNVAKVAKLTEEGRQFYDNVAPHLEALAVAVETQSENLQLMRLRLGVLPLFGTQRLFPRLPELRRLHPRLRIDIDTGPHLLDRVGDTLDAAVVITTDPGKSFHKVQLDQNRVHAICSRDLAERLGRVPDARALSEQTFLIHTDMPLSFEAWKNTLGLQGLQPNSIDHYDSGQLILEAAAQGLGIAIMHDDPLKRNHDPRLSLLYDDFEVDSPYSYWFVCRHVDLESRPVRLFHDWLVEARL